MYTKVMLLNKIYKITLESKGLGAANVNLPDHSRSVILETYMYITRPFCIHSFINGCNAFNAGND